MQKNNPYCHAQSCNEINANKETIFPIITKPVNHENRNQNPANVQDFKNGLIDNKPPIKHTQNALNRQKYTKLYIEMLNYSWKKWFVVLVFGLSFINLNMAQQDSLNRYKKLPKLTFIPTEKQKKQLFSKIMHDTTVRYKQAFYHLCLDYFFRDLVVGGFTDSTFLDISQSTIYRVFRSDNYYIGVAYYSHSSDIILMSSDFVVKDVIRFGDSYPPDYQYCDIDNDGIKEFIFYEQESSASFISTNPAFMVIVAINKEKGKFEQVLRLPFANFHLDEDRSLDLIDEEKTKVVAIGKNTLRATHFLRKKNQKKWKQVKVEIYKKTGKYQYTKVK